MQSVLQQLCLCWSGVGYSLVDTLVPQVKQRLLPVELPLLAVELEDLDVQLAHAEQTLFWNHEGRNPPMATQGQRSSLCTIPAPAQHLPSGPPPCASTLSALTTLAALEVSV